MRALIAAMLPAWFKAWLYRWICGPEANASATPPAPAASSPGPVLISGMAGKDLAMYIVPGDIISDALAASGLWEPELTQRLLAQAQEGGLLVEVGANLGYFSLLWAQAHPANRVIALEPAPRNIELFRASIACNGLSGRVSLLPVAAGPRLALMPFDLGPEVQTGWGGVVWDEARALSPTQVVVVPLDELLAEIPQIAVLKIDVEGFDTLVLEGCRRLLSERRILTLYYEQNHPRMAALGIDPGRAHSLLAELGYETWPLETSCPEVMEWIARPKAGHP
ncbi:FkbM family methyltransferase [Caldichromatium japonicum]|uniref:FkbM family methyltransferase n=1 Tax=Caldichromatium japonicum TaxID=2699430 RepID=A0A6G7V9R3_9GAMM|nr:FkbM family methyltransferase [Caldichromatium japonicum]QIK36799.1 FkbM family methyltransferase [Caldichromatium japonicum]